MKIWKSVFCYAELLFYVCLKKYVLIKSTNNNSNIGKSDYATDIFLNNFFKKKECYITKHRKSRGRMCQYSITNYIIFPVKYLIIITQLDDNNNA